MILYCRFGAFGYLDALTTFLSERSSLEEWVSLLDLGEKKIGCECRYRLFLQDPLTLSDTEREFFFCGQEGIIYRLQIDLETPDNHRYIIFENLKEALEDQYSAFPKSLFAALYSLFQEENWLSLEIEAKRRDVTFSIILRIEPDANLYRVYDDLTEKIIRKISEIPTEG
jgi:hypothetical protein